MSLQSAFHTMERISFSCAKIGRLIEEKMFSDGEKVFHLSVQYVRRIERKVKDQLHIKGNLTNSAYLSTDEHAYFLMKMDWIKEKYAYIIENNASIRTIDLLKVYQYLLHVTDWYINTFAKEQSETETAKTLHLLVDDESFKQSDEIWQERVQPKWFGDHRPAATLLNDGKDDRFAISLKNHTLYVPNNKATFQLRDLQIKGCNHFLRELARNEMYTLQDLPKQLDMIHLDLIGVGPATVRKMWEQLTNLFPSEQKQEREEPTGDKVIYFAGNRLTIPEHVTGSMLTVKDYPTSKKLIEQVIENDMHTYGELPTEFEQLKQFDGIGSMRIKHFFEQMKQMMDQRKNELHLDTLTDKERIEYEYKQFIEWSAQIKESAYYTKKENIPKRYIGLMQKRFYALQSDTHVTLQQLGDGEGLTRERIRQIFSRGNKMIAHRWGTLITSLKDKITRNGAIIVYQQRPEHTLEQYILEQVFESAGIYMPECYDMYVLTTMDQHAFHAYKESLTEHFYNKFELTAFTPEDIHAYCEKQAADKKVPYEFMKAIVHDHIDWINETLGILKNASKVTIVELVMLRYPQGVAIYKEEEELNKIANQFMPGKFVGKRDFTAVFSREEIGDKLLLWARGVYIHKKFVTADEQWVHRIQRKAHALVQKKEFMHVRKLYALVKDEAEAQQVPNEYALFSLMRLYDLGMLDVKRFPMIQLLGEEQVENTERVIQYVKDHQKCITKQDLIAAFVDTRGWKPFTIDQILSESTEIIPYEHGVYTLMSNYDHLALDQFTSVLIDLENELAKASTVSVRSLFEDNKQYLEALGVETPYILYALLSTWEVPSASFDRFPEITYAAETEVVHR